MRIKRYCAFLLALTFALGLALSLFGCHVVNKKPLFEYLGEDALAFADAFRNEGALSLTVRYDGEASGEPYTTKDEQTILAAFNALDNMIVISDGGSGHTDDYLVYYFEMHDGSYFYFNFQKGYYLTDRMELIGITGFDELITAFPPQSEDFSS